MSLAASALPVESQRAFLGVQHSLTGKLWRDRLDARGAARALAIAQRHQLPEMLARVLAGRDVDLETVPDFLDPTIRKLMPDPHTVTDMEPAARRIAEAALRGEKVAIFGDYDVDGATSSALLSRFLTAVGARTRVHIPDRRTEGYGPNLPALLALKAAGAGLVVTVDCGTTAHGPLGEAAAAGLDVIVVDHHAAEPALPAAVAIVNPNRLDDTSGQGSLAAVGVTFLLIVGLNRALKQSGWYGTHPAPDLLQWLDLVALGTVCDVVPLVGLNRVLVAQGVKVMATRRNPGLVALSDSANVAERLDAYHLGYVLGPRVNAGGRVGRADLGVRLLSCDDPVEARRLAAELEQFNAERKEIEALVQAAAIDQVEQAGEGGGALILAHGPDWHPGVIGIVAGRLKERYNRPACVIAWEDGPDGRIGKGSGRSVPGIDLGSAVIAARQAGLLIGGGGHRMAAGFTVAEAQMAAFSAFMAARLGGEQVGMDLTPELGIDGLLSLAAATTQLLELLAGLGPYGAGNAEPRFVLPRVRVIRADVVGQNHVRCILAAGAGPERMKAIAFRALETELGAALLQTGGATLHIAGHLRLDSWQGRTGVQMLIDDAAPAHAG
jgi:single-stranded-DNA-specific exonuclease